MVCCKGFLLGTNLFVVIANGASGALAIVGAQTADQMEPGLFQLRQAFFAATISLLHYEWQLVPFQGS